MNKPSEDILDLPLVERAEMAFKAAVEKAMERHAREGLPAYILRDGEVIEISSEELKIRYPQYQSKS
jgi:hypothetical protein